MPVVGVVVEGEIGRGSCFGRDATNTTDAITRAAASATPATATRRRGAAGRAVISSGNGGAGGACSTSRVTSSATRGSRVSVITHHLSQPGVCSIEMARRCSG